jgi:hypothetical protein
MDATYRSIFSGWRWCVRSGDGRSPHGRHGARGGRRPTPNHLLQSAGVDSARGRCRAADAAWGRWRCGKAVDRRQRSCAIAPIHGVRLLGRAVGRQRHASTERSQSGGAGGGGRRCNSWACLRSAGGHGGDGLLLLEHKLLQSQDLLL